MILLNESFIDWGWFSHYRVDISSDWQAARRSEPWLNNSSNWCLDSRYEWQDNDKMTEWRKITETINKKFVDGWAKMRQSGLFIQLLFILVFPHVRTQESSLCYWSTSIRASFKWSQKHRIIAFSLQVERWTIEKKLGEGGFGAVYRVYDATGRYALKVEGVNEQIQVCFCDRQHRALT